MIEEFKPEINGTGLRIGIVKARFNENIGEGLFNACVKELMDKGRLTLDEGKELQSELKRRSQEEAKDLLGQIKEKSQSLQYATKEDLQRLEGKLDALLEELKQSKSDE